MWGDGPAGVGNGAVGTSVGIALVSGDGVWVVGLLRV